MAFPRFLVLGQHIGGTLLQNGQPFHRHPDNDYNIGYLQPSLYGGVSSDKHVPTSVLQQAEASVKVALSGNSFGYSCLC